MTRLLEWTFKNRLTVLFLFAVGSVIGLYAVSITPVDAVPDITPVQVVVNTKTGALDPEQIEKTVSFPIETDMSGIALEDKTVTRMAEHSLADRDVITEAMADVWEQQGNRQKAIETYRKLSLLNPSKSAYFAAKIDHLK